MTDNEKLEAINQHLEALLPLVGGPHLALIVTGGRFYLYPSPLSYEVAIGLTECAHTLLRGQFLESWNQRKPPEAAPPAP